MAQAWSPSVASLESVFTVLSDHDHPFVMVGKYALPWMGVPVHTGYIMDILVRTSQAASIRQSLAQTREWMEVDDASVPGLASLAERREQRSIGGLKRLDDYWYICLCTEDTYQLMVDTKKIQVPHVVSLNAGLVESEFHPNPLDQRVRPFLITDKNIKFVWAEPITFPVFIPTIPEYLDSCLNCTGGRSHMDDESCDVPESDMAYLSRYLVLDSPHQRDKLLSEVHNAKLLEAYFIDRQRRQEIRMKKVMERRMKHASHLNSGLQVPFVMLSL
ncbi:hypothetical protein HOY80DRAFT_1020020 [Tuber brumale]|nr:hypothetical protein HOY80DRAFT_1020020 [Tuber brumale]